MRGRGAGRARVAALLVVGGLMSAGSLFAQERAGKTGDAEVVILENGLFWTGDPGALEAYGVVVRGDRIEALAWTPDERLEASGARRIDLGGRRVIPGFNDAHTHFFDGGFTLLAPDLLTSDTPEEFVRRLAAYVATLRPGQWVDLGAAWDHQRWPDKALPSRALIDAVTPDNPVWVVRPDGHIGLANSLALELAGITRNTPDPPSGRIDRDPETGEPTGILRDAGQLIRVAIPFLSTADLRASVEAGLAHAARLGVTSTQDMCYESGDAGIGVLRELARDGRLTTRFFCRTALEAWSRLASHGVRAGTGDAWLRWGSLKAYADGALGSSTAYMFEPYEDDPSSRGILNAILDPVDRFAGLIGGADAAGLQLSIHAIGDAAISLVLDQFEALAASKPAWDRRWRIEHAQHMAPRDFDRMARLGVVASVQPFHAIDDGRWAERKIGATRAKTTYAFRSFLDAGVPTAFGTDWPVAPLEPMRGVYAAVTRRTLEGAHDPDGWVPEERVSVAEAISAYTYGSAYAEFTDHEKGLLIPGYLADLVALSDDPFAVDVEQLPMIEAVLTMVGGRVVYAAPEIESGEDH